MALTIMAVIAVLSWRGIDGMLRAQESTRRHTDEVLAVQAGLAQWRADLDAMMRWPRAASTLAGGAPLSAANQDVQRALAWDGGTLRVTRLDAGDPTAGLRVVAWTRRASGRWMRWQSPSVLSQSAWSAAWDAAAAWGQSGSEAVGVLPGSGAQAVGIAAVLDWQIHYYRNNAWTNPQSSGAESDAATQTLPDGVRLGLTLAPGQALSGPLQLDWVRPDFVGRS